MPTLLRIPDYPVVGQPLRRGWGVAVVDKIRDLDQRTPPRLPPPLRPQATNVSLTWTVLGALATLNSGLMLLRGQLVTVDGGTVTLATDTAYAWLQFSISPSVTPTPEVQVGTAWPSVDLGIHGIWPLARFTTVVDEGARTVSSIFLYHPGGNIAYPLD